ncbi:DegV family protein [Oscillibacter sp. MSJ-31]|uniref:DegV family protein n=1 Tax=Oscillibacter sp. MSJ-31 TaxID=2841526 RepID=UPI001C0F8C80|nr:DegV family protein [Oscillibacter sp. MSJ-31]MBU5456591.1 DegV family protein [Oscillibacter sp. MSJ-31]
MTKLYTDTSANLPLALLREYDIAVIPFSYTVNGVAEDYNEETDFDGKAFYDAMRRGAEVKTSMVNPATAAAFFERALAQGDDVLYVGMSGGISGTAHAAALAAEELREKYPHAKIMTIDTYAASLGEGLQVLEAAELLRAGRSFEEVGDRILVRRPHMCQFFTVDDLNYLKRGGRISGAAALVGSVLGIKPILRGDETGHIVSCGKVRGNKKAYAELADYFDKRALDKTVRIGIAHADNREGTDYLLGLLRERGFTGECLEVYYEPVTGAHVGPGTVALFFYGTEK